MPRSPQFAIFGGGVAVNLSWRQPPDQLVIMTRNTGAGAAVASPTFTAEARQIAAEVDCVRQVLWLPRPNECGFRSRMRG